MLLIDASLCLKCGGCVPVCPEDALILTFENLECIMERCTLCGVCIMFCPVGAVGEGEPVEV